MALEQWGFDLAHSSVSFWVRHLMVSKVHGRFTTWKGALAFDEKQPATARLDVEIDAASIDTREPQRDAHLQSPDFLDVAKYPHITFKSASATPTGAGRFQVKGDLTIRGTTRPVTLEVEYAGRVKDPWGGERAGFSARTTISRKDFGLAWNQLLEGGGFVVDDKVEISIEAEAVRNPSPAKA
jgi:polyisoprenoid-binding protein YceI